MEMLAQLWLPILLATLAVQIASTIAWTAIGHHSGDHKGLTDEDGFLDAVRRLGVRPGTYKFPHYSSHKDAKSPEMREKWAKGPAGLLTVLGPMNMGRNMGLSALVYLAVSVMVAWIGAMTLPAGSEFARVFQVLGVAGVLGYSFAFLPQMIWFGGSPRAAAMCVIDGVVYGLITGAVFAWLWPGA